MSSSSRSTLRRQLRRDRRALDRAEHIDASLALHDLVTSSRIFRNSKRVASYSAFDGEIDPAPINQTVLDLGKKLYLPVIDSNGRMRFAAASPGIAMSVNRFGIQEPAAGFRQYINPRLLDLVITPLVAFDTRGYRLGMGAGFYDRCFAFLRQRNCWQKPKLMGVGFDFQRADRIDEQPWDVQLWCIATDRASYVRDASQI